jgi:hypothetical protein
MAAQIVELASCPGRTSRWPTPRLGREDRHPAPVAPEFTGPQSDAPVPTFHFWRGASRFGYVHTAYRLIECPDVANGVYLLVKVAPSGRRTVLEVGMVEHDAPSLNLAHIRQRGATLGADEVHLHLVQPTHGGRRLVELDLQAGLMRSLKRPAPALSLV